MNIVQSSRSGVTLNIADIIESFQLSASVTEKVENFSKNIIKKIVEYNEIIFNIKWG